MPKQSPIPDAYDKPFWDACNEERLVLQNCSACNRLQHPPAEACSQCGNASSLEWKPATGTGRIRVYGVVYDGPVASLHPDQPFNCAVIDLDDDPGLCMLSHLPGVPVDKVPVGAPVRVIFEPTPATGQKVPEWVLQ